MTLAGEDTISELVNVVTVAGANANAEECLDDSLVDIFKLDFGQYYEIANWLRCQS